MTAPITLGTGEQPAATAVEPSPLAVCANPWCRKPVAGPLDACDEPDCQYQDARLARLFAGQRERNAALAGDPDIRAEDRAKREDL